MIGNFKIDPDLRLGEFIKFLKENNISYSCYYDTWDGHQSLTLHNEFIIDNKRCKDICFEFLRSKADSKLDKVKTEYRNELDCWVSGTYYKRSILSGGSLLG